MSREPLRLMRRLLGRTPARRQRRRASSLLIVALLSLAVYGVDHVLRAPTMRPPHGGAELSCAVVNVHDGDTITARCPQGRLRVRVWGIDAPEIGQRPWGYRSRDQLKKLLGSSHRVKLQVVDTDRYGRSVARLYVDGTDLGLQMVRSGQAIVYRHYNDSQRYRRAEAAARQAHLGIWSRPGSQQHPAVWRHLNSQ